MPESKSHMENGNYDAFWDFHEGIAYSISGDLGPKAPEVTKGEFYVSVALLRQLKMVKPVSEWDDLIFPGFQEDFGALARHLLEAQDKLHNALVAHPLDNRQYYILGREKRWLRRLKEIGVYSTILTGAEDKQENREQIADIVTRSEAVDLLNPDRPIKMRPPHIRNSAISKALHHGVMMLKGARTIALDNEEYVLNVIESVVRQGLGIGPMTFCTLAKAEAEQAYKREGRFLPRGATSYIDRSSRFFGDQFEGLIDTVKRARQLRYSLPEPDLGDFPHLALA